MPSNRAFYVLTFDGASRDNPKGPAGCGWMLFRRVAGLLRYVRSDGAYLGYNVTSNQAEYQGLIAVLRALQDKLDNNKDDDRRIKVTVRGDSELIIKQMKGEYQVSSPNMKPLHKEATELVQELEENGIVTFQHIERERNKGADRLANRAINKGLAS